MAVSLVSGGFGEAAGFEKGAQGRLVLTAGELAGADVGRGTGGQIEFLKSRSGLPQSAEPALRIGEAPLTIQGQAFLIQGVQRPAARNSLFGEGQELRPAVRNGRRHRADEREYKRTTSHDLGRFQNSAPDAKFLDRILSGYSLGIPPRRISPKNDTSFCLRKGSP